MFLTYFQVVYSQNIDQKQDSVTPNKTEVPQIDLGDVLGKIFKTKNKPSEKHKQKSTYFSIIPGVGYSLQTGFSVFLSTNISFYNGGKTDSQKISLINANYSYTQYKQSIVPFYADIWTKGNKINFLTDFRYLDYPSDIYGLGDNNISTDLNSNTGYEIFFKAIKFHQTATFSIKKNVYVGGGIYYDNFWKISPGSSIKDENIKSDISNLLGRSERSVGVALKFLYDNRLNQINPQHGGYFNVLFRPNFKFLGSNYNWSSLLLDARKYFKFPASSQNIWAFWGLMWLTPSKTSAPYLLMPSTAWDDQYNTGRGYTQSRFRGNNMFYFENEYRFRITRNGFLGGVVFCNFQSYSGNLSDEFKKIHPGYGFGLRIKMNKKSKTNLSIDYGFGDYRSRGFFVNLGEVF